MHRNKTKQQNSGWIGGLCLALAALAITGCATLTPWTAANTSERDFVVMQPPTAGATPTNLVSVDRRLANLVDDPSPALAGNRAANSNTDAMLANNTSAGRQSELQKNSVYRPVSYPQQMNATGSSGSATARSGYPAAVVPPGGLTVRAQSPDDNNSFFSTGAVSGGTVNGGVDPQVRQTTYQYPDSNGTNLAPPLGLGSPSLGSPNEVNPLQQPDGGGVIGAFPQNYADLDIYLAETQTGRINFGGAYNSDNGIVGQFTVDERNFDITRFPRNLREMFDGTAFRGGGQTFRLELVPGANLERYLVSFSEPYFAGTNYSFSASGYYFQRQYFDWDEQRLGGRFSFGRRLTPDLSISMGIRMESVTVDNPRLGTSTELNNSLGTSNLFLGNVGLIKDTRDHPFMATKGSYFALTYSQAFGDYSYSRGDIDYRRYRLLYERPDGSGRHTLSFGTRAGFSGSDTPIFENYFAGGFSTMRGFDFRGASPIEGGVRVGGDFQWLNSLEYVFPLTADDMIRGVMFCDFGTVEENIEMNAENFRVAPGFGFRVNMPAAGIGAPLAFDFAFPVSSAAGDEEQVFSFYLGVLR